MISTKEYRTCFDLLMSMKLGKIAMLAGLALLLLTSTVASSQGITQTFNYPGTKYTAAEDINHSGQVVGFYNDTSNIAGLSHGFLYNNGRSRRIRFRVQFPHRFAESTILVISSASIRMSNTIYTDS